MGEAIDVGQPELALEKYNRSGYWSKSAMPTYEASVAAYRLGNWYQAFRYAAYAQDMTLDLDLKKHIKEVMKGIPQSSIKVDSCSHPFLSSVSSPLFISCPSRVYVEESEGNHGQHE